MKSLDLPSLNTPKDTISPGNEPWYQYFSVVPMLCAAKMPPKCLPVAVKVLRVVINSFFTHSLQGEKETILPQREKGELKQMLHGSVEISPRNHPYNPDRNLSPQDARGGPSAC